MTRLPHVYGYLDRMEIDIQQSKQSVERVLLDELWDEEHDIFVPDHYRDPQRNRKAYFEGRTILDEFED